MRMKSCRLLPAIQATGSIVFSVFVLNTAYSQTCGNTIAAAPAIFPISGSQVMVGQTVTIGRIGFNVCDPGSCYFRNGEGFLVYPDGATAKVVTNLNLNPPGSLPPPSTFLNCFGTNSLSPEGSCIAFNQNYVVNAADVGRAYALFLPPRGDFTTGLTVPFGGVPGRIYFGAVADCDGRNPSDPAQSTGSAVAFSSLFLKVVSPGISVTKVCDPPASPCGGTNFAYGAPITFTGTVCDTGDVPLVNISVTDSSNAVITFAATTSSGRPFNPLSGLTNGECVNYSGSYVPSGNLSGPFSDTVHASGVASTVFANPVVTATNIATCSVCPPSFTSARLSGSDLIMSGSGGVSNASYVAVTTSNLLTPMHLWTPILTDTFSMDGHFAFTNHLSGTKGQGYFRLKMP